MANVKLGKELRKDVIIMLQAWDKEKKSESPGMDPMTFRTPVKRSSRDSWRTRPYTRFMYDMRHVYC